MEDKKDIYKQCNVFVVKHKRSDGKREPFTMIPNAILEDKTIDDGSFRLYSLMSQQAYDCQKDNRYLSDDKIMSLLGIKESTLYRRMNVLEKRGWLKRETATAGYKKKYTKYEIFELSPQCETAQEQQAIDDMYAEYSQMRLEAEYGGQEQEKEQTLLGATMNEIEAVCYIYGIVGSKKERFINQLEIIQEEHPRKVISKDTLQILADTFSSDSTQDLKKIAEYKMSVAGF